MTLRLAITALSRRATLSRRSKKNPSLAVGEVHDVHNDFLHSVLDWLQHGKVEQMVSLGDEKWTISCKPETTKEEGKADGKVSGR